MQIGRSGINMEQVKKHVRNSVNRVRERVGINKASTSAPAAAAPSSQKKGWGTF